MSNSPVIPREKLSAYQRWEMHSFDIPGGYSPLTRNEQTAADDAAKHESIRRAAYEKGRAEGLRDGALKASDDARRLRELLVAVSRQSQEISQHLADDLLGLSLEVARQMVRQSLTVHPELIVPLLKDALTRMSNTSAQTVITLHPADAVLVRTHLAEAITSGNWQITEDASVQRGGAVLQTATSHVDATLSSRWQHLTSKLGLDDKWIG